MPQFHRRGSHNGQDHEIQQRKRRDGNDPRPEARARRRRRASPDCFGQGSCPDHGPGWTGFRRSELSENRPARTDLDRGLPLPGKDIPLRPRTDSRTGSACARLCGARLLRELQVAIEVHQGRPVPARRRKDACLRPIFHRRRKQGIGRSRPRRPGLRREALHAGGQLGHRRQQYPGFLHSGRDQVSGPDPRGEGRAGLRLSASPVGSR